MTEGLSFLKSIQLLFNLSSKKTIVFSVSSLYFASQYPVMLRDTAGESLILDFVAVSVY